MNGLELRFRNEFTDSSGRDKKNVADNKESIFTFVEICSNLYINALISERKTN